MDDVTGKAGIELSMGVTCTESAATKTIGFTEPPRKRRGVHGRAGVGTAKGYDVRLT